MRLRPTPRAGAFLGTGALLVVVGTTAQAGWLFVLAAAVTGPVLASAVLVPRLRRCVPDRRSPLRAPVGQTVSVALSVHNGGRRFLPLVRVEDQLPAWDEVAVLCDGIAAGATARSTVDTVLLRRGRYESGPMMMWSSWPFGLVRSSRRVDVASSIVVTPRWIELAAFSPIDSLGATPAPAGALDRAGGSEEFFGVREYRFGDDARHVHWRSSARMGRLIMREYEEQSSSRVTIVLAGGDHGSAPDSSFEALVSAAASVALYAIGRGHGVEFVRPAEGGIERVGGVGRAELLDWLAAAAPMDVPLRPLVGPALESDAGAGTVVLFIPTEGRAAATLQDAAAAAASRGCTAAAVVADASTWDDRAPGPDHVFSAGIPVHVLRRDEELRTCLER